MKNNKGFSLVELIVVIAIMAILASVAVIGVSVYVPKAQKAADQQAINDVMDALTLHYYSNPETVTKAYVILGPKGVVLNDSPEDEVAYNAGLAAMEATFGADWQTAIQLQYEDWQGVSSTLSYADSSYFGHESELINTVDELTGALGKVIEDDAGMSGLVGGKFGDFLAGKKVNTSNGKEVGNAAVLYVAQTVKDNKLEIQNAVNTGISKDWNTLGDRVDNIYNSLIASGVGDATAMATVYAITEGYARYTGQTDKFNPDFGEVAGADAALDAVGALSTSFNSLDSTYIDQYIASGQGGKDLQGYVDMMETIHKNENIVSGNLSADDCFTDGTVETLLKGHSAMGEMGIATTNGQIAIVLVIDENGTPVVHVAPLNWDK